MDPITLDRSTLERYATCPYQGYVLGMLDTLAAVEAGERVFDWEQYRLDKADHELIAKLKPFAGRGRSSLVCDSGVEVHRIIETAFKETQGNLEQIPERVEELLSHAKPNIQPEVIKAGRYVCDVLADLHVKVIGVEVQMDYVLFPATEERAAVIITQALDLIAEGREKAIHILDWKTGRKRRTSSETADSFQAQSGALMVWKQKEYAAVNKIHWWYHETRFGTRAYAKFERDEFHPRLPHLTQELAFEIRMEEAAKLFLADVRRCEPMPDTCCFCDAVRWCPEAHIDAAEIAADPAAFIDSLIVTEALVQRRKKAATAWLKAHGPIVGTKAVFQQKKPQARFTGEVTEKETGKDYTKTVRPDAPASTGDAELDGFFK